VIHIHVEYATQCDTLPPTSIIKDWIRLALKGHSCSLNIKVVDEKEMTALHSSFKQKSYPTNVLSFPCTLPPALRKNALGDIAICAPVIVKEAKEQRKLLSAHWAHMVIHGVLHLIGYNHEEEKEAQVMEKKEAQLLHTLGFPDPYQSEKI